MTRTKEKHFIIAFVKKKNYTIYLTLFIRMLTASLLSTLPLIQRKPPLTSSHSSPIYFANTDQFCTPFPVCHSGNKLQRSVKITCTANVSVFPRKHSLLSQHTILLPVQALSNQVWLNQGELYIL